VTERPRALHSLKWRLAFLSDETGASTIEYMALSALLVSLLLVALPQLYGNADLRDSAFRLAVVGVLVGAIGWSVKQSISALEVRAQLIILELLSDGKPRTRGEIGDSVTQKGLAFRLLTVHPDALAALVLKGRVTVSHRHYALADAVAKTQDDDA